MARSAWGKGYATEAVCTVRDFAFATLGIKRLIAMIDPSNVASIRVAEKIGMKYEKEVMFEGYSHPDHVYSEQRYKLVRPDGAPLRSAACVRYERAANVQ